MHLLFPFLVFAVSACCLWRLGRFMRTAWGRDGGGDIFEQIFLDLYVGLWGVAIGYAAVATGGKTVMLGVLGVLFLVPRGRGAVDLGVHPAGWRVHVAVAAMTAFVWESVPFGAGAAVFPWRLPYLDSPFYAAVSQAISEFGVESGLAIDNGFRSGTVGPSPYHYVELWLNAVVFRLFQLPALVALHAVVVPLYLFLCLLALLSLFARDAKSRPVIASLALFVGASAIVGNQPLFQDFTLWGLADAHSKKAGPWFVAFLGAALRARAGDYRSASAHLLALPIATITAAPAVIGGLFLVGSCLTLRQRFGGEGPSIIGGSVLIGAFLAAFYAALGEPAAVASPSERLSRGDVVTTGNMARLGIVTTGRLAAVHAPWALALALALAGRRANPGSVATISVVACMVVVGFAVWAPLVKVRDSAQVFLLPTFTGLWICTAVLWSESEAGKWSARIGRGLLVILALVNLEFAGSRQWNFNFRAPNSSEYLGAVQAALSSHEAKRGASIYARDDAAEHTYRGQPFLLRLGWYLLLMPANAATVPLNDFDLPEASLTSADGRAGLEVLPFRSFVEELRASGSFSSITAAQVAFIRSRQLSFVILSRRTPVSQELRAVTGEWITDPVSGERFGLVRKDPRTAPRNRKPSES